MIKNKTRSSRIRRQRGYSFEYHIVKLFNNKNNWQARRLGSPSTGLPDVCIVNNAKNSIVAIEAKSVASKIAYVPFDEIQRCIDWVNMFSVYEVKHVVLAFKFKAGNNESKTNPIHRKLCYYYKIFPYDRLDAIDLRCNYDGKIFSKKTGEELHLEDAKF